jgi:predicted RNase H-like HicB family nuclease
MHCLGLADSPKERTWRKLPMFQYALTGYIESALSLAEYDKLEDESFSGRIPDLRGVIAFGKTLRECEEELRSTLEDWVLLGLKLGHTLPVIAGHDLNQVPTREPMAAM